jgi:carbohydrate diacid regulator
VNISKQSAQTIIDEVGSVLQQQLNFFNAEGIILASTNPERIGQFHEGAASIVRDSLPELIVYVDDEYRGARKGCNFPLVIDQATVGVIGITGNSDEVYKYGRVIKKMTEILLKDSDAQERKKIEDRIRTRFLDDWILTDQGLADPTFLQRAQLHDIDVTLPRRVVLFRIADIEAFSDNAEGQQRIDKVNRRVRRFLADIDGAVFSKTSSSIICLIPVQSDKKMLAFIDQVFSLVQEQEGVPLIAGADSGADAGGVSVHQAYLKALKALQACMISERKRACLYDDTTYELFLDEISEQTKTQFIRHVFRNCTDKEIMEYACLLKTLYETDGSISKTAEAHFIHKNTLQYKLNKLTQKTGSDPRSYIAIPLYHLAVLFSKS